MGKHKNREELTDLDFLEEKLLASLENIKAEIDIRHKNGEDELVTVLEKRKKELKRKIKGIRKMRKQYQTSKYSLIPSDEEVTPIRVPGGIQGAGTRRKK